jgi:hypothetical protein
MRTDGFEKLEFDFKPDDILSFFLGVFENCVIVDLAYPRRACGCNDSLDT